MRSYRYETEYTISQVQYLEVVQETKENGVCTQAICQTEFHKQHLEGYHKGVLTQCVYIYMGVPESVC